MKNVIKQLEDLKEAELKQVGMTPLSSFQGTQEEHDLLHVKMAEEYEIVLNILKSKIQIRDWTSGDTYDFDNIKDAYTKIEELSTCEEVDYQLLFIVEDFNNIDS